MNRQRGVSLGGLLLVSFLLIIVALLGLKVMPSYLEYFQVKKAVKEIMLRPETKGGNMKEIRQSFVNRSTIDNISAVKAEDLELTKDGTDLVLSAAWSVKTPLVGNVSVCIDFAVSSQQ